MIESDAIAEAQRALGRQLAAARRAAGYNQERFAPLTTYSRSTVANVETGRQHVGRDFWERCDRVLETGERFARGYDEIEELRSELHRQTAEAAEAKRRQTLASGKRLAPPVRKGGSPTKRRQAMGLVGAAFAHALWPDALETFERVQFGFDRLQVDSGLVQAHQELSETLAGLYRSGDPRVSMLPAMAYADSLLELLDTSMSEDQRIELATLAVGAHAQVGLWACHMHRSPLAYRYLATACEVAATVGDRPLQARAWGALSYLYSSAPRGGCGGQPKRALALLDEALMFAAQADAFTRGWLATWRADQHATLGNLAAARTDVQTAERDLEARDIGQVNGFFARTHYGYGMKGHLDSVHGVILALDGNSEESTRTFASVQSSAQNMRRRVATYGHEALAHVNRGNAEAACVALQHSVNLATQVHYGMGLERALGVRQSFPKAWADLACVHELDEHFRELTL